MYQEILEIEKRLARADEETRQAILAERELDEILGLEISYEFIIWR
jgi:hypothetical protein